MAEGVMLGFGAGRGRGLAPHSAMAPSVQAQRPEVRPPNNSRPLPHRYLQDTASKLGQDAFRFSDGRATPTTAPTTPGPGRSSTTPGLGRDSVTPGPGLENFALDQGRCAEGDANMWRRIFHAEALECVQAMQAVIDSANLSHCASRFEDWRKFDLRATAQMQQHVKEVMQLNRGLDEFLRDCATPEEFAKFKGSVVMLTDATEELSNSRREICKSVDSIAERASVKVVAAWEGDVKLSSEVVRDHTREQHGRWMTDDARWAKFEAQVTEVQENLGQLRAAVGQQTEEVSKLVATQVRESSQVASAVQEAVKEMHSVVSSSYGEVAATFQKESDKQLEAFKSHTFDLLVGDGISEPSKERRVSLGGSGRPSGRSPSLGHTLRELDSRMNDWDSTSRKEAQTWRESAEKLRWQLDEQTRESKDWTQNAEDSQSRTAELEKLMAELREDLRQGTDRLQDARAGSMNNSMKRLKDLEGRGNVKMNRQTGAVTLQKLIEFLPCKPNEEPVARLVDEPVASQTLQDVAQLASMFDVSWMEVEIRVKVSKGGSQEFWDNVAETQRLLVRELLELGDFPMERLTVKGVACSTDSDCLVRLDSAIFVDQPKGKAKAKAR